MKLVYILEYFLFFYFAFFACYNFYFVIMSFFYSQKKFSKENISYFRFAIIMPGYKEDFVMVSSLKDALLQNYPKDKFLLVPVVDHFSDQSINEINKLPVKLIDVNFEESTKAKAINLAFDKLNESDFDYAVILDADNIMERDFIKKVNNFFNNENYLALQAHRTAKNLNTEIAILDAVSEEINNIIFRKGHVISGLSSAIIGSGMVFKFSYLKNLMRTIKAVGGFDKEIELKMLKDRKKIYYLDNAFIYDEKVSRSKSFYNQRRRWISAQFIYLKNYFTDACINLVTKLNVDYFNKALQMVQPPRIFVLIFPLLFFLINYIFYNPTFFVKWLFLIMVVTMSIFLSIPRRFYNIKTLISIKYIPKLFFLMFLSIIRIRGANKKFLHTNHEITTNN